MDLIVLVSVKIQVTSNTCLINFFLLNHPVYSKYYSLIKYSKLKWQFVVLDFE